MLGPVAAVVFLTLTSQAAEPTLLLPGRHAVTPELPRDGSQVLALCGTTLKPMRLDVTPLEDGKVTLAVDCDARVLLSDFESLGHARVRPAQIRPGPAARSSPFGPSFVTVRLGQRAWRVDRIRLGSTGYRLLLRGAGGQAVLYEAQSTDAARWELLWAGDLDGDARVDLIVDAADAFDQSEVRLYLSRGAEEAVDEVASVRSRR